MKFHSIVFAGGGVRSFWQIGFYESIKSHLKELPKEISAVSAGSAMAAMIFSDTVDTGMTYFKKITAENEKNTYWKNLFNKKRVFPHYDMYRSTIIHSINKETLKKIQQGPEMRVLITRPPGYLGPVSSTLFGMLLYTLEKIISGPVHPKLAAKFGYKSEVVSFHECKTPDEMADLILQSSCTPPFLPVMKRDGKTVIDGGLIDNVPVSALTQKEETMLVMLTRKYDLKSIPQYDNRIYVQPSEPITIDKWEYADPDGVEKTYNLGLKDGENFIRAYKNGEYRADG